MTIHPSFFDFPQWPPLPHPLTGLRLSNQAEWGLDEWRLYAKILEMGGEHLLDELLDTQEKLSIAEEKASRSKKTPVTEIVPEIIQGHTLLTSAKTYHSALYKPPKPKPKRGRKADNGPNSCRELAKAAIAKRAELESAGNNITDEGALAAVYDERCLGKWRAMNSRHVLNEISSIRTKTDTRIRTHKK